MYSKPSLGQIISSICKIGGNKLGFVPVVVVSFLQQALLKGGAIESGDQGWRVLVLAV